MEGMGSQGKQSPCVANPVVPVAVFNVWEGGDICRGNVQVPEGTTTEKIDAWNAAFLGSFFTHPNGKGKLVRYRGGAYPFWRDMLDGKFKKFPERVLVDVKTTLGKLLGMEEPDDD